MVLAFHDVYNHLEMVCAVPIIVDVIVHLADAVAIIVFVNTRCTVTIVAIVFGMVHNLL